MLIYRPKSPPRVRRRTDEFLFSLIACIIMRYFKVLFNANIVKFRQSATCFTDFIYKN